MFARGMLHVCVLIWPGNICSRPLSWTTQVVYFYFPVGREKLMPFVDPDRIEQSDRVQAASFASLK